MGKFLNHYKKRSRDYEKLQALGWRIILSSFNAVIMEKQK